MKEQYQAPKTEIISFADSDILTPESGISERSEPKAGERLPFRPAAKKQQPLDALESQGAVF